MSIVAFNYMILEPPWAGIYKTSTQQVLQQLCLDDTYSEVS